jgi:membrane protease YdiL (CAAX protease family)
MSTPLAADYVVLAVFLLGPVLERLWLWPRHVRATAAGVRGARNAYYRSTIAIEWILTLYVLALWAVLGRPWDDLYLGRGSLLRLGLGLAFALAVIVFFWNQQRAVLARPKLIERVRQKMSFAEALFPHTGGERYHFWLVAITAGICEEILYRGFLFNFVHALFSFLGGWTGIVAAIVISSIVFGWAHIYLGYRQAPRTALVGPFLAVVVVLTKSLWPAILIHAAIDVSSGELGFAVHQAGSGESAGRLAAELLPGKPA